MPSGQSAVVKGPSEGPLMSKEDTSDGEDEEDEGPMPPPPPPKVATSQDVQGVSEPEYEPEYEDAGAEDDLPLFPITHEAVLKDHTKVISAIGLDPSGARLVSGSHDYDLKLWDFGGMDSRCKPFKSWEPAGSYYVRAVVFPFVESFV